MPKLGIVEKVDEPAVRVREGTPKVIYMGSNAENGRDRVMVISIKQISEEWYF